MNPLFIEVVKEICIIESETKGNENTEKMECDQKSKLSFEKVSNSAVIKYRFSWETLALVS